MRVIYHGFVWSASEGPGKLRTVTCLHFLQSCNNRKSNIFPWDQWPLSVFKQRCLQPLAAPKNTFSTTAWFSLTSCFSLWKLRMETRHLGTANESKLCPPGSDLQLGCCNNKVDSKWLGDSFLFRLLYIRPMALKKNNFQEKPIPKQLTFHLGRQWINGIGGE